MNTASPRVGIVMGSRSDWDTLEKAAYLLDELGIPYETRIVSAHRTPDLMFEYAASAAGRGLKAIIAGAGGAAHLPGMLASKTRLPVLGVPVKSRALNGLDSLLSIVQMPKGVPVATFAIGAAGEGHTPPLFSARIRAGEVSRAEPTAQLTARPTHNTVTPPHPPRHTAARQHIAVPHPSALVWNRPK